MSIICPKFDSHRAAGNSCSNWCREFSQSL